MKNFREWLIEKEIEQEKIDIEYSNLIEGIDINNNIYTVHLI